MNIELIICTYMRPKALCTLLDSVEKQTLVPQYISIIDGSTNDDSGNALRARSYSLNIRYHKVPDSERGLTRQRNYGIDRIADDADYVAFLDDDTVLEPDYFEKILNTFFQFSDAIGVGGYIQEGIWKQGNPPVESSKYFQVDGWYREEPRRYRVRKAFGLGPPRTPCIMPPESNGRSITGFPPSGLTYPVEYFMGGVATYRRESFEKVRFSEYFEGYGLYEDLDFCLRLSRHGQLYVNTAAVLHHYHEPSGRPNKYQYGKMVIRNGWYVWRVKFACPTLMARFKWWSISLIQAALILSGSLRGNSKIQSFTEGVGRFSGMFSLLFSSPKVNR